MSSLATRHQVGGRESDTVTTSAIKVTDISMKKKQKNLMSKQMLLELPETDCIMPPIRRVKCSCCGAQALLMYTMAKIKPTS